MEYHHRQRDIAERFLYRHARQGKYRRKKINGGGGKQDETDHIVFENNHTPIVDYKVFALAQEQLKKRTTSH